MTSHRPPPCTKDPAVSWMHYVPVTAGNRAYCKHPCLDQAVLEATCGYVQEPFNVARDGQDPFKALYGFHFRFDTTSLACHATRQALRWWRGDDSGTKEDGSQESALCLSQQAPLTELLGCRKYHLAGGLCNFPAVEVGLAR